jgi:glycosyltransferase involved in cell wall biosynthesis
LLSRNLANYDVIHIHDCRSFQGIITYMLARIKKVPYVFQPHGSYLHSCSDSSLKTLAKIVLDKTVSDKIIRGASKVIALNQTEAAELRLFGVPNEKIAIIPNGVDLAEYSDLPSKGSFKEKFGLNKNEKIVLYLGRIHEIKGIDILVKAFANIIAKLDDVRLVIIGPDDGYLSEIEALTKALKIESKVLFAGPLYGEAELQAYVDSNVYVLPSRYEIWGLTVLEAYACGTPVIASKVGGLTDLVLDGITGFSIESGNIHNLADAITVILNDDCRAREMGLMGELFVKKNFDIRRTTDKLEFLYKSVLDLKSSTKLS